MTAYTNRSHTLCSCLRSLLTDPVAATRGEENRRDRGGAGEGGKKQKKDLHFEPLLNKNQITQVQLINACQRVPSTSQVCVVANLRSTAT